jgi:hypothetical protein
MKKLSMACLFFACLSACASAPEVEPTGPIARFGSPPTLDGVHDVGEWDDAEIVRAGTTEKFRMKHDGVNLYFAIGAGGGNLVFNTDEGLRVLHWSGQLGSAEYVKSGTGTQSLDKPFAYELPDLYKEPPAVIQEALAGYLAEKGWASSTASMGHLMQSELAVSFDWLGVNAGSGGFIEIPSARIDGGLIAAQDDPRVEEFMALPLEERKKQSPSVAWPSESAAKDSIRVGGGLPDTLEIDPADYGEIWIDLRR